MIVLKRIKSALTIAWGVLMFWFIIPAILHADPITAFPNGCAGSWDCYWWAKFHDILVDLALIFM